jgi:exopolysaccharide biosynthesis predicted pyruvyltransferase EpsI
MTDKILIDNYLKQYRNQPVIFVPNPGNAGDSLITHSIYQLFDKIGLSYEVGELTKVYTGQTVFYSGGGNLVHYYHDGENFILANYRQVKKLIILPHTIQAYPELLNELGANVDIFCRELTSFNFVKQHVHQANVYHSDDMAFHLDIEKTFTEGALLFAKFNSVPELSYRNLKRYIRCSIFDIKNGFQRKQLNAFRYDVEKTAHPIPLTNIDLSQVFATDNTSRLYSHEACFRLLNFINLFDKVATNRLHIAIAAALLNKFVNLYPNSYNKNESMYQYSMRDRYPNVIWKS